MSYHSFYKNIDEKQIKVIFELGSRDLIDSIKLINQYSYSKCYSFECNPDCLIECKKTISNLSESQKDRIFFIEKAVSLTDGEVTFYPFDLSKYNNMGASSLLKIDFSKRPLSDPDYNKKNVQKKIKVNGIRLDTFINKNNIENIDLLCIDLQGYELNAIKSLGKYLHKVKYIITECSIVSTYTNGSIFIKLNEYLTKYGFKYRCSNKFGYHFPDLTLKTFLEFDALFINNSLSRSDKSIHMVFTRSIRPRVRRDSFMIANITYRTLPAATLR